MVLNHCCPALIAIIAPRHCSSMSAEVCRILLISQVLLAAISVRNQSHILQVPVIPKAT